VPPCPVKLIVSEVFELTGLFPPPPL